jgi:c-di-GMP-binding flagellar brake protein YcgR
VPEPFFTKLETAMSFQSMPPTSKQKLPDRPISNRRVAVRYKCGLATPGRIRLEGEEWQRAWVLDLSFTGVGLLLGRSLQAGQHVVVHLRGIEQSKVHEAPCQVRHATRQVDGEWVVGCEFFQPLTAEQLDALLQ